MVQSLSNRIVVTLILVAFIAALNSSAYTQKFQVDDAILEASPAHYTGSCPGMISFKGKIQATAAGRVNYSFIRSDGARGAESYVDFDGPGVRYVDTNWTLGGTALPHFEGWIAISISYPNEYSSNKAGFVLDCGPSSEQPKSQKAEGQKSESGESKAVEPKIDGPKVGEPNPAEAKSAGAKSAEAKNTEPTTVKPGLPGPATQNPKPPSEVEEKVINDVDFKNWGFEDGLTGWTSEGNAFRYQPTYQDNVVTQRVLHNMEYANGGIGGDYWKDMPYPIGIKGNYWIGTYELRPNPSDAVGKTQGDVPTGTLTSPEFRITKNFCDFLIGGGQDKDVGVELQIKTGTGAWKPVFRRTSFRDSEELYRTEFDLREYHGFVARIQIIDMAKDGWGHINVDDFRFLDELPQGILLRDQTAGYYLSRR